MNVQKSLMSGGWQQLICWLINEESVINGPDVTLAAICVKLTTPSAPCTLQMIAGLFTRRNQSTQSVYLIMLLRSQIRFSR
ncbi:hypothetical protein CEXT_106971 [Caerostris extrusa]|uniref:Uncharacterized protein n=1 Tax=Caerostris extrusa TaxID=172846 RepID=A0AAV4URD8_CAEEX|nr:hypothetical protein CEXT_106971 [Caerostris extrusa]